MHNDPVSITPKEVIAKLRSLLKPIGESFDVANKLATTNFELFCDPSDYEGRKVCTELRNTLRGRVDSAKVKLSRLPDEQVDDVYALITLYRSTMRSIRDVFYGYDTALSQGLINATLRHEDEVAHLTKLAAEHEDRLSSLMGKVDKFEWLLDDSYSSYVPLM